MSSSPHLVSPPGAFLAEAAKAWPFEEARKLVERYKEKIPSKGYVLFETGYGPSGLPHMGTFGEVVRTSMVRYAFQQLSGIPTRLFCFSDDLDGLRKVPGNIPKKEMMEEHLGKPLTSIPDPFGTHESFGHHNNSRLQAFLDSFGFEYEFLSATRCYQEGLFDTMLLKVLEHHAEILDIMLPTLGEERQATYSPFLPICPETGQVLQVSIDEYRVSEGVIVYRDLSGKRTETPVTGGRCKLQWKADWGMRWAALGVDYEMSGKDLIDSVKLSRQICGILGAGPPEGFNYELFLDQDGQKISKSKGNGLSVEEWLSYSPPESLCAFMYQAPRRSKRLFFNVIPRQVDDYLSNLKKFEAQSRAEQLENPVWHIHKGNPPPAESVLSFTILLNLASVCHASDKAVLWGFIERYVPGASPQTMPFLDRLVGYAVRYYQDFVAPHKHYRLPTEMEIRALEDLEAALTPLACDAEIIQQQVYEVGKRHAFSDLKSWFQTLYQVLLGQDEGPRMGSFIALYGIPETLSLIRKTLERGTSST